MKKIIGVLLAIFFCTTGNIAYSQWDGGNALEYSISRLSTVPPYYAGQPTDVVLAYYWFDQAMRTYSQQAVDSFFNAMQYSDTSKYIADAIYRVTDDNPISFHLWLAGRGIIPDPYRPRIDPSHTCIKFEGSKAMSTDTGRSAFLLASDIISDVKVLDTFSVINPTFRAKDVVRVTTQILDQIKGKYVPSCAYDTLYRAHGKVEPQSTYSAYPTAPVHADTGTCLQFEYSLEWDRMPNNDDGIRWPLVNSAGTWVKPDSEYIIFLQLQSVKGDSLNNYFTVKPIWGSFGSTAGMYPVHNGIVSDPFDDFGIGASSGLTVSEWKNRIRARINKLINP